MANAHRRTGGGLNSSSGGELKLYLMGKRNTQGGANIRFCLGVLTYDCIKYYQKLRKI